MSKSNYQHMLTLLDDVKCEYCNGSGFITLVEHPKLEVICIICEHTGLSIIEPTRYIIKTLMYYNDIDYRLL